MVRSLFCVVLVLLIVSCAAQNASRADVSLLSGNWIATNGVIVRMGNLADGSIGAEITSAPGFYTNDPGAGSVVLRNIRPWATGYMADFVMPGRKAPVPVRMRFLDRNTIVFTSADRRLKGTRMVWKRLPRQDAFPKAGLSAP